MSQYAAKPNDNKTSNGVKLPAGTYTCRFLTAKFEPTSTGKMAIKCRAEIVSPDTVEIDGAETRIASNAFNFMFLWVPGEDWGLPRALAALVKLGWDADQPFDPASADDMNAVFKNTYFNVGLTSRAAYKLKVPGKVSNDKTPEADYLLIDGQKVLDRYVIECNIQDIIGKCDETGSPF